MRTVVFLECVLILVLAPLMGLPQTATPTISDFGISGIENVKPGEPCTISYNFKSNQRPDEVIVDSYMVGGGRFSRRNVYSSKKGELRIATAEKEGLYEVAASRDAVGPPASLAGATWEIEVWITSGGQDSNKLRITRPIGQ